MKRPTTVRGASKKRGLWPHVVDARAELAKKHGVDVGPIAFASQEDMRPVCTRCRERIDDCHRSPDPDRAGFFLHTLNCPTKQSTYYIKGEPGDLAKAIREALGPDKFIKVKATAPIPDGVTFPDAAPAAPPVDEELERERARLVGKRVRNVDGSPFSSGSRALTVRLVDRNHGGDYSEPAVWFVETSTRTRASAVEPIPDEKPRETTFGELAIGEWFIAPSGVSFEKVSATDVRSPHVYGGAPNVWFIGMHAHVTRIDPPSANWPF